MSKPSISDLVLPICLLCIFTSPAGAQSGNGTESPTDPSSCDTFRDLEKALLENDTNKLALSVTFFPLESNTPEFVKVTYDFGEEKDIQVWYWSSRTSNFIHPFEVMQFLSLFFNKPEPYYTGNVRVSMNPDCATTGLLPNKGVPQLQLLTQRMQLYATSGSPNIALRETYSAKAYDNVTLRNLIVRESEQITNIIITMAVFVVLFSAIIIVLMLFAFVCSTSHTQSEWFQKVQNREPAVLSFTVLSFGLTLFILSLDGAAMGFWNHRVKNDFFSSFDRKRTLGPITTVLIVDILAIISWFFMVIFSRYLKSHAWEYRGYKFNQGHSLILLSLTVLCPIFCIIAHSPYIAIAYLNDGSHASSIFIYYAVLIYIFYGIIWLFFHWCEHYSKESSSTVTGAKQQNSLAEDTAHEGEKDKKRKKISQAKEDKGKGEGPNRRVYQTIIIGLLGTTLIFLLGLVVTATCYFVFIPINKSISDAPSRILSIYQSGGFVIGSFILYKVLRYFYSKKHEEKKVTLENLLAAMNDMNKKLQEISDNTATKPHGSFTGKKPPEYTPTGERVDSSATANGGTATGGNGIATVNIRIEDESSP